MFCAKYSVLYLLVISLVPFGLFAAQADNSLTKTEPINGLSDDSICCRRLDFQSPDFIDSLLLEASLDSYLEPNTSWSVLSELEDDEDSVRNEIDLLEVDEIEPSEESVEREIVEQQDPLGNFADPNLETTEQLELTADQYAIRSFDEYNFNLDYFAEIENGYCQKHLNEVHSIFHPSYTVADIPVLSNKKINAFIHLYTVKKRDEFEKAIKRFPKYQQMIADTLAKHELPLNLVYLAIVESNLNPKARSRANAVGLWQFMSYTGKHFGLTRSWWHDDRYDPERSTEAAAVYLKRLNKQFKGDWELALAAYNSGSGTVRRAIRKAKARKKSTGYWSLRLPRETRGYVPAFYAVATIFDDLERYGFQIKNEVTSYEQKKTIEVGGGISLKQLANVFDLGHAELAKINPRLKYQGLVPPTFAKFEIAIPASIQLSKTHQIKLQELTDNRQEEWKVHKVKQGETLWSISRYYRIPMKKIRDYNRLNRRNLLRIGQKLMLPVPVDWSPPKLPSKTKLAVLDLDKVPGITKIHVVKKGETLWRISQIYNIPIKKIRYWNRRVLRKKYLKIGTEIVLKVPATAQATQYSSSYSQSL